MSKIDDLINKLCPNGVEYKKIKECTEMKRGTSATKNTLKEGNIPVISGGKEPSFYCNQYNRDGETITVAGSGAGAGYVQYWNIPIFVNDAFSIKGIDKLNTRFIYHYLLNIQDEIYATKKGGGVPHVHISSIENFKIAVPPLEVQDEIVHILDDFTLLSAELSAELKARQQQYEYYKERLLSFSKSDSNVEWITLGTYCKRLKGTAITAGKMKEIANDDGNVKIFAGGKTMIYTDETNIPKEDIIKIPNIIVQSRGIIDFIYYDKPCSYKREMWSYTTDNEITLKYIYYYLKNNVEYFRQRGSQMGSMPQISLDVTEKYKIPMPDMNEQKRIVNILDRFDKLCNDISEGLPAEIEARQKQYEYYRDKLLTFKELEVNEEQ